MVTTCLEGLWSFHLGDTQNLNGHGSEQPAQDDFA